MTVKNERIFLSPPHMSGRELEYIQEAFDSNWIAPLGPQVDTFEREMAEYTGTKGALALSSGTAALHLALRWLGVGPGDRVFCSSLTFIASVAPVIYLGAEPVFIDSEPETWNMSPLLLSEALQQAAELKLLPKAIIAVSLYGHSADLDAIKEVSGKYGVPVIEDAAEALGATYKGKACGSSGVAGAFSFNGNKIITTSGGGMLVSNDLDMLDKCRFWATQARDPAAYYQHSDYGYNYRMSNLLAAVGRGQLTVLDDYVAARRKIFSYYQDKLSDLPGVGFMPEDLYGRCSRWLTVLTVDSTVSRVTPMVIINALEAENIEARPVWKPMHLQPLFAGNQFYTNHNGSFSESAFNHGVCLPSGSALNREQQDRIITVIKECFN